MNQRVSSAFVDLFWIVFSAFDQDTTWKHVIMTTASNKHSLDTRNGQFSHLLVISLQRSNVVQDDYRRGRPKWWNGSTNGTGRSIATLISVCQLLMQGDFPLTSHCPLQFGTLRCSLTCTHSAAKWNGICSGDNTRVRGCLCSYYVSYALSQRDTTSVCEIEVAEAS